MLSDFQARHQQVYWQAANPGVIATLKAIVGEDLKLISGPIELACSRHESPKLGLQIAHNVSTLGTITEMVTISEEIPESKETPVTSDTPNLRRFTVSPPENKV